MSALAINTPLAVVEPAWRELPAQANVQAFEGSACTIDPDGNVGPLASGERFVGHAFSEANNLTAITGGGAAAIDVKLRVGYGGGREYFLEALLTCTKENEGQNVYMSDDSTYTLSAMGTSTPNVLVGTVWRYVDATHAVVLCKPATVEETLLDTQSIGHFHEEFLADALLIDGTHGWKSVDVNGATEAIVEDAHGGQFALTLTAAAEAQDAVLYMGDNRQYDLQSLLKMRFRASFTLPGTGEKLVAGMGGDHNLDKDTMAQNAWFSCDAALACKCETDDGTNDNDDIAAITLTTAVMYDFEIDFSDDSDVKFFINGAQVAGGTTFDMSNYTGTLQPYFSADTADATAATGALIISSVDIFFRRA